MKQEAMKELGKLGVVFILMAIGIYYLKADISELKTKVANLEKQKDDCNDQIKQILLNRPVIAAQTFYNGKIERADRRAYTEKEQDFSNTDRHGSDRRGDRDAGSANELAGNDRRSLGHPLGIQRGEETRG